MMKTLKNAFFAIILIFGLVSTIYAQSFYDMSTIQTIEVTLSQSNWDQQMDNAYATSGDYIMADSVKINGVTFDSVGVKFKGNSSYKSNQKKNPWHIELDTYKEQDYQGYKDIKLANSFNDPSFLRDVLGYQIIRQYMDAPLANYANLYVNGTLIGLYSNTESISKTFVKSRFGSKTNAFFNCSPPDGASPQSDDYSNLVYQGQDSIDYFEDYELKSDAGWQELINLCDTLKNYTNEIENILDIDRVLWMLAFDNAIVNLDSYIGIFSQNYYLYRDDYGRFLPIVWDLNESFGVFSQTGSSDLRNTTAKQQMSHLLHLNDTKWPLIQEILSITKYKKMYLAHMKTILQENFANNSYYTTGQTLQTLISPSVEADKNKFFSHNQFISNLTSDVTSGGGPMASSAPGITRLMDGRSIYLLALADFTQTEPAISNISLSDSTPVVNQSIYITALVNDADNVFLKYRYEHGAPFAEKQMYDDGMHNDALANDNIYGIELDSLTSLTQYYLYAENSNSGKFSPQRAAFEFYSFTATPNSATIGDLVINEFLASNETIVADQDGEYDDWIELYNNGSTSIALSGYFLSDDITNTMQWEFPTGTVIEANGYLIIWADDDEDQSGLHANFKLSASGESVILSDASGNIIDNIDYPEQNTDISYGRYPNGTGSFQTMTPTFNAENTLLKVSDLVINEFLASNETIVADQDGEYDDWIELYNNGSTSIALSGYFLSDDITNTMQWEFPTGTVIEANGYLIIWADDDEDQSGLHANFKLSASGESVILSDASGNIIDNIDYPEQNTDISYGRYPNGTGSFQTMTPTFNAENIMLSGLTEFEGEKFELNVYPNPTQGHTTVFADAYISEVHIYDLSGKLLKSFNQKDKKLEIDLSNIISSMCFIKVITEDGRTQIKKVLFNK